MFSCFSLPPSSSSPEDGFLSFSEKREKRKTAFRTGSPFSVFLLGKLPFSSLLRNASFCRPLRREKEKKEIAMLSESFVRREEPPSFFLFPLEGRSRHFSQKRKRKKRRGHRNPSSWMEAFPVGGREKEKKEKSERKESSCLPGSRPWEKSEEKRRDSVLRNGSSLLQKGERLQMRDPEEKKRETFSSAQGRISSRLSF